MSAALPSPADCCNICPTNSCYPLDLLTAVATAIGSVIPFTSVMSYGAKGDGVTDDTAAIQSALDTLKSVILPPGQYKITHALHGYSNQSILGFGASINGVGLTDYSIRFEGAGTTVFQPLALDAVYRLYVVQVPTTAAFAAGDFVLIHDPITGATELNIVRSKTAAVLTMQYPFGNTYAAANASTVTKVQPIQNFWVQGLTFNPGPTGYGLYAKYATNFRFEGNTVNNSGHSSIALDPSVGFKIVRNTIIGSGQAGVNGPGIGILQSRDGIISQNRVFDQRIDEPIVLYKNGQAIVISQNVLVQRGQGSVGGSGILLDGQCSSNVIEGNIIFRAGDKGIYLTKFNERNIIVNNVIRDCLLQGIRLEEDYRNVISGNHLFGNGVAGGFALEISAISDQNFIGPNYYDNNSGGDIEDLQPNEFSGTCGRLEVMNGFTSDNPIIAKEAFAAKQVDVVYSPAMGIDLSLGNLYLIVVTDAVNFTVANPNNAQQIGQQFTILIRNAIGGGGVVGVVNWDTLYKLSAWTSPADGYSRSICFVWNGTHCIEIARTPADVPN